LPGQPAPRRAADRRSRVPRRGAGARRCRALAHQGEKEWQSKPTRCASSSTTRRMSSRNRLPAWPPRTPTSFAMTRRRRSSSARARRSVARWRASRAGAPATSRSTVLAEKSAGAAAESGADLAKVTDTVKRVNAHARSFGVALSSCVPPASGKAIFELPEGQVELGIGIHGEPGRRRAKLGPASEIVDVMVEAVVSDLKAKKGAKVLAFLNGMGGTPLLELYLLYGEVDKKLRAAGLEP